MSNSRKSVSSDIQTPRLKKTFFQLTSRCLEILMEHSSSCLIYYILDYKKALVFLRDSWAGDHTNGAQIAPPAKRREAREAIFTRTRLITRSTIPEKNQGQLAVYCALIL